MPATINGKTIGDGNPVFIVLEAGPTHTGLESAMSLADSAAAAGVDAIKFQVMDVDRLMGERDVMFDYRILTDIKNNTLEIVEEPLYDILKRRQMPLADWKSLKEHCDKLKLGFIATAVFEDEVDFMVDEAGVDSIKLASGDINHIPLIRHMARKGVNIQLDTGSADLWEIDRAVSIIEDEGNSNIVIHLCPTGYPARLESINLRMLRTLKSMFPDYAIAFSDHTPGWNMDIAAVAIGVDLVEKTITHDRTTRSCEHMFSLEPMDAGQFVKDIRELEVALGSQRRTFPEAARKGRLKVRRSAFSKRVLKQGETLKLEDIEFRRPGSGIPPDKLDWILGKALNKDIQEGLMIQWDDIS